MQRLTLGFVSAAVLAAFAAGCGSAPLPPPVVVPFESKMSWIVRLEDQRLLRDPSPPPPAVLRPASRNQPVVYAPPPPSVLVQLLGDPEGRVRRRAALALGRGARGRGGEARGGHPGGAAANPGNQVTQRMTRV